MALPDDLLRTAALGTEQQADQANDITGEQPEAQLLLKVVTLKLRQQAGYQPFRGAIQKFPPAPREKTMPCSGRALRHLLLMIVGGKHINLLPVWLKEMVDTGQHLPEEVLPLFLSHDKSRHHPREILLSVIGERGKWLAEVANNVQWRWVLDEDNDCEEWDDIAVWQEYLKRFRQRDPDAARETLEKYWADLDIKEQSALLETIKHGLSHHDEAFLTTLLDTERLSVQAARMLCSIPDTEFGQAVRQTLDQMLIITRMGRRDIWVIDFRWSTAFETHPIPVPEYTDNSDDYPLNNRWTPEQMLSFIPLSYWYERWQTTPEILVEGGRNSTKPSAILNAFSQAAIFADDKIFAYQALLQNNPNHMVREGREQLINLLGPEQKEEIGIFWLDQIRHGFHENHPAKPIVEKITHRWGERLMLAFLASLERSFTNMVRPLLKSSIRLLIEQVAAYFSLEMIDEVKRVLKLNKRPELSESELEIIDGIVVILEFQQEMIRAIRNHEV